MEIDPNLIADLVIDGPDGPGALKLAITGLVTFIVGALGVRSRGAKGWIRTWFRF